MENMNLQLIEFESFQKNVHSGLNIMYVSVRECTGNLHEWILKHVSGIKVIGTVANCGRLAMTVSSSLFCFVDVT
jgi:hypothetical protein